MDLIIDSLEQLRTTKRRLPRIRRLVALSLGTAGVFGLNSIFFFMSQNYLGDIAASIEKLQAFDHILSNDRSEIIPELERGRVRCLGDFPGGCEAYVGALLFLRYRCSDYSSALKVDFRASGQTPVVQDIESLSEYINRIAGQVFGLSFPRAKSLRIGTPESYIEFIRGRVGDSSYNAFSSQSAVLGVKVIQLFEELDTFSSGHSRSIPDYQSMRILVDSLFRLIVITEILVFLFVGSISLLNVRAEILQRSQMDNKNSNE